MMLTEDKLWTVQLKMMMNICGAQFADVIVHHVFKNKLVVEIRNTRNNKVAFGDVTTTKYGMMADNVHNQLRKIYSKTKNE